MAIMGVLLANPKEAADDTIHVPEDGLVEGDRHNEVH